MQAKRKVDCLFKGQRAAVVFGASQRARVELRARRIDAAQIVAVAQRRARVILNSSTSRCKTSR